MQIRPFTESDITQVTALWLAVFPDNPPHSSPAITIEKKLAYQRELFFVGELDGAIVGTVLAGYDGHRGWLYSVAVHANYRRRGLGKALIEHTEDALYKLGAPKINLQVRTSNAAVVAFYQALGYDLEERISMGKLSKLNLA